MRQVGLQAGDGRSELSACLSRKIAHGFLSAVIDADFSYPSPYIRRGFSTCRRTTMDA
ncbi:hypothetical protein BURMUCGD1_4394 [Burkholderia multivorans CGD1]|nr:hypothetical protein BURMUCGD1_4394 [Burkholderia multivorans CGD1]